MALTELSGPPVHSHARPQRPGRGAELAVAALFGGIVILALWSSASLEAPHLTHPGASHDWHGNVAASEQAR